MSSLATPIPPPGVLAVANRSWPRCRHRVPKLRRSNPVGVRWLSQAAAEATALNRIAIDPPGGASPVEPKSWPTPPPGVCPQVRLDSVDGTPTKFAENSDPSCSAFADFRARRSAIHWNIRIRALWAELPGCAIRQHSAHSRLAVSAAVLLAFVSGWKTDPQVRASRLEDRPIGIGGNRSGYSRLSPKRDARALSTVSEFTVVVHILDRCFAQCRCECAKLRRPQASRTRAAFTWNCTLVHCRLCGHGRETSSDRRFEQGLSQADTAYGQCRLGCLCLLEKGPDHRNDIVVVVDDRDRGPLVESQARV